MKKAFLILISILFSSAQIFTQTNGDPKVSVTVYNSNLGVIKDVREINLKSGISEIFLTDVAQYIDPTSVHINLNGNVLEQNYRYDLVSLDKIMQRYIDKEVQLINENNELLEGKLLSVFGGQLVLEKKEGGLILLPSTAKYRINVSELPEGLITKPTLVWMIKSNSKGVQDVEVSYQTSGLNWHAEYVAVLNEDDTKLDLNAWVSIDNNSGAAYKDAKLKLVAGDVNRVRDEIAGDLYRYAPNTKMTSEVEAAQFEEKAFFEYHIYNLERQTTLANNETKQIALFQASNVNATKKYLYAGRGYGYSSSGKVAVVVEFENSKENGLGVPMPKGKIRMNKSDGESIEFIGEDLIDHTPKNEKVKLKIGDAFDIIAEESQKENRKITDRVYEQEWEIKIKNRKEEDIVVEVERYLGAYWTILKSSIDYEKKDSQKVLFKVPVGKDSETILTYKVRYNY